MVALQVLQFHPAVEAQVNYKLPVGGATAVKDCEALTGWPDPDYSIPAPDIGLDRAQKMGQFRYACMHGWMEEKIIFQKYNLQ